MLKMIAGLAWIRWFYFTDSMFRKLRSPVLENEKRHRGKLG